MVLGRARCTAASVGHCVRKSHACTDATSPTLGLSGSSRVARAPRRARATRVVHWMCAFEDRDPATGNRKRRWHSGFRTKREAQAACNELAAAMQRGDYLQANRQTVGEFAEKWLVTIAPTVRPSMLDKYQRDLRAHVLRHIGFVPLAKLDGPGLNRLWAQLALSGRKPAGYRCREQGRCRGHRLR